MKSFTANFTKLLFLISAFFISSELWGSEDIKAPFNGVDNTVSTNEDSEYEFSLAVFTYTGGIDPITAVIIEASAGSGTLYYDADFDDSYDVGEEVIPGTIADTDISNLRFMPVANENGTNYCTIDFHLEDSKTPNAASSSTAVITIDVTPVNDPLTVDDATFSIDENSADGTVVGTPTFTDPDNGALVWSITGGNGGGEFAIDAGSGEITLVNPPGVNYEGTASYSLTVQAADGGDTGSGTITVNINDINETPTSSNNSILLYQDDIYTFAVADFSYSDDDNDPFNQVQITTTVGKGTLWVDSDNNDAVNGGEAAVVNGDVIAVADITKLKYKPLAAETGIPYTTFQFNVHDGTVYSAGPYTMTMNVSPINQEPYFTKGADVAEDEDVGLVSIPNWATGISAGSAGEDITQTVQFFVSNNNNSLFSVQPAVSAAGELTFTTAADKNGAATVTIYIKDDGGTANGGDDQSPNQTFTITVNAVNDAPVINPQTFSVDENSPNTTVIGDVVATDVDGDAINYSITAGNTNGAFAIGAANGRLTVANSGELDYETTTQYSLTVQVEDATLADSETITININDVNDIAPTIGTGTYSLNENEPNGTIVGLITWNEPEGNLVNFSIISGNTGGAFDVNNSGQIFVAASEAVDFETTSVFTLDVQVNDGGFTANALQTINLIDQNDPPRFTSSPTTVSAVGALYTYDIVLTDDESDPITVTCPTKPTWLTFTDNGGGSATLNGIPAASDVGNNSVVLSATDGNTTREQSFTIYVASSFVDVPADHADIQTAIDNAADGGVIMVASPGTYGKIDFKGKNIAIIGNASDPSQVVLQGNGTGSVVTFNSGEDGTALLQGFTVSNGIGTPSNLVGFYDGDAHFGGGIYINNASPKLENINITNNVVNTKGKVGGSGAGVFITNGANPTLENVKIYNNTAPMYRGGGVCVSGAAVTIKNSQIYDNAGGNYGGGLSLWKSTATLENVSITGNEAGGPNGMGGGMFLNNATINISSVTISGNSATDGSNGIFKFNSTINGVVGGSDNMVDLD